MRIADLGAKAVRRFVARAGVVHCDPGGVGQPGAQHIARFGMEAIMAVIEQTDHLALGDEDAERVQQRHQPRRRGLALMVLGEHEAAQFRPEVTIDAGRQRRRQHPALRGQPALAAEIDDMTTDHQVLHHEARRAFEARAGRRGSELDDPLLIDRKFRAGVAPRPSLAAGRRLRIGCLLHAARLDVRPRRPALEPCDLVTQRRHHSVQLRQLFPLLHHQALELGLRQAIRIDGRRINGRRHAHVESD